MSANAVDDVDHVLDRYHLALGEFMKGDHEPVAHLLSERDDVTLGNPHGPFARGRSVVVERMQRAASYYREGEAIGFDEVSRYVTPELACFVEVERFRSKVGGGAEAVPFSLRVTSIFRREDERWRLIHRHADPITSFQPAESVLPTSHVDG